MAVCCREHCVLKCVALRCSVSERCDADDASANVLQRFTQSCRALQCIAVWVGAEKKTWRLPPADVCFVRVEYVCVGQWWKGNMAIHCRWNFSKVISSVSLHSKFSSERTFEYVYNCWKGEIALHCWQRFSKVCSLISLLYKVTTELTFEKLNQPMVWALANREF